jgi:hypothetical protein
VSKILPNSERKLTFCFLNSYWDATTNNWAFDYDAYYAAHPQVQPSLSTLDNATYQQQAFEQASAYGQSSASGFNTFGPSANGDGGKQKKIPVGPKDANGELIAGKLKKGQTRETVLRKSVGKLYEDQTLLEWDPSEYFQST